MEKKISLFIQLIEIKRYSPSSINTFVNALREFLNYFKNQDVDVLKPSQIEAFINEQVTLYNISVCVLPIYSTLLHY